MADKFNGCPFDMVLMARRLTPRFSCTWLRDQTRAKYQCVFFNTYVLGEGNHREKTGTNMINIKSKDMSDACEVSRSGLVNFEGNNTKPRFSGF